MAPVKVYGPAMSANVARILLCLEEVGAGYEVLPVDMLNGEHKSPAHVARNVCHLSSHAQPLAGINMFSWTLIGEMKDY